MTLAKLTHVLQPALRDGYAVAGLVFLGWEDMRVYVTAAKAEGMPVILQAGPACRAHTCCPFWARCSGIWLKAPACRSWPIWIMPIRQKSAGRLWIAALPR